MLQALKKAIKDKEKKKPSHAMGSGGPSESPLVDLLSEIRMIRTLQMRVNLRTGALLEAPPGGAGR